MANGPLSSVNSAFFSAEHQADREALPTRTVASRAPSVRKPRRLYRAVGTPSLFAIVTFATVAAGMLTVHAKTGTPLLSRIVPFEEPINTIGSLKGVQPVKPDLSEYIVDKLAAQQLGKALFWDTQVGSNGAACASCHFHAGADIRIKNQVDPGVKAGDKGFEARGNGQGSSGPNKAFTAADFPFHRLANPSDRESAVLFDTNDVFSSQGSLGGDFISSKRTHSGKRGEHGDRGRSNHSATEDEHGRSRLGTPPYNENCSLTYDPANNSFHANGLIYRKVEPRQTPTNINAVFNVRQFWDGRANSQFNGLDPFGPRTYQAPTTPGGPGNPDAHKAGILVAGKSRIAGSPKLSLVQPLIDHSSLASQAVGPALSDFEMSCAHKTFPDLGRKLLPLRALAMQHVAADDSLLGQTRDLVAHGHRGLNTTYRGLIEKAFAPKYWRNSARVRVTDTGAVVFDPSGFDQMEHNFSLFWGLAVQEYESLLISDDSPFDRTANGDANGMSEEAQAGQVVFMNKGGCIGCHFGPAFSSATITSASGPKPKLIEHMQMGNGYRALYDAGYYNIGVRPTTEDIGVGATDPYGFDLSYTRQYKWQLLGQPNKSVDRFDPTPCKWVVQFWPCADVPTGTDPMTSARDTTDGSFKAPILRNVGLTPPYFHNGGQATLKDVVRFYNRGGDRRGGLEMDTSGHPSPTPFGHINRTNLSPDIGEMDSEFPGQNNALNLTEQEMDYLVQFLLSLTDDRVACHSGVFDHPELPLVMGQEDVPVGRTNVARDIIRILPAVGKTGLKAAGKSCFPNTGDLFGTLNKIDTRPLQVAFEKIIEPTPADNKNVANNGGATSTVAGASSTTPGVTLASGPGTMLSNLLAGIAVKKGIPAPGTAPAVTAASLAVPQVNANVTPTAPPTVQTPVFTAALNDIKGFTAIGFIQAAQVSSAECPNLPRRQWGGTATINGIAITIPCNSIVQMPAATFTWAELFPVIGIGTAPRPASISLNDTDATGAFAYPSNEIRVEGNIVAGRHIAGLVYISQQSLNTGAGFITGFEPENGVILVGNSASSPAKVRLQLNDVKGRFSKGQSPDERFNVDDANPTIRSATGYPMCVPRTDPSVGDDPLCPQRNRPKVETGCRSIRAAGVALPLGRDFAAPAPGQVYCSGFVMGKTADAGPREPSATLQAPFEIGDYITYSGTLLKGDRKGPNGSDTISAHTVVASVGIFTEPGTLPSYIAIGEFRISSFTPTPIRNGILQEEQDRIILEAFTTDLYSIVDIYLVDVHPTTGEETQRWITPASMTSGVGAIGSNGHLITGGITTQRTGPVPGRVRLRATRAVPGILTSPTRYMRVVARSLCDPANINATAPIIGSASSAEVQCLKRAPAANGLFAGQYLAPVNNFIFPENLLRGDVPVPNNFWDLGFLATGEGPGTGPLMPTPW